MRNKSIGIAFFLLALVTFAAAQQNEKKDHIRTVTEVLDHTVSNAEQEFVGAADAMPADKFNFTPTNGEFKGVRNFGQQIKHVAAVNYELGAAILEEKPPVDINDEAGPALMTTKDDIMKYIKDSFEYAHKAVQTINEKNQVQTVRSPFGEGRVSRLGLASTIAAHAYDHYGQMVEYLRMNGIVPPASR